MNSGGLQMFSQGTEREHKKCNKYFEYQPYA